VILPNSKDIVIANPPFGAQRDKESYPNVWSEYPTESETTILFVKLMLETIKPGGLCAVIVSEGFLTWDQNSARALRRALLEGCDLQAIISLPQGVFVSKGGQGPKTSILVFVKGRQTERVWFYKVTNDGYSMGTNRKPLPGCQLVEALDLFHTYVRQGQEPPESRHSFCIPAEWIKTLDPRTKDRIRAETRADMAVKRAEELARLEQKWAAQIAAKRLTETGRLLGFARHADLWEAKTQNEIARKIERAHLYSFNLPNYRSGLTAEQLAAWRDFAASRVREGGWADGLERRYRAVAAAPIERLDELLSSLDPRHALELDWARQFLAGVTAEDFERYPHLGTLQEIIASQQRTPRIALKELLEPISRPVVLEAGRTYRRVTVKLYGKGVVLRDRVTPDEVKGDKWFQVTEGDLIFSRIDARNGAFGLIPEALDGGIVSNEFPTFSINSSECHPNLLAALLTSEQFWRQIEEKVSGASGRRRMEPHELLDMQIPIPRVEHHDAIACELEKLAGMTAHAKSFMAAWDVDLFLSFNGESLLLGELAEVDATVIKDLNSVSNARYIGGEHIQSGTGRLLTFQTVGEAGIIGPSYPFTKGQVVYSKVRPSLRKCFLAEFDGVCSSDIYPYSVKSDKITPEYLALVLTSSWFGEQTREFQERAGMPKVNREQLATIRIVVPSIPDQQRCVNAYRTDLLLIDGLDASARRCEERALEVIRAIWES